MKHTKKEMWSNKYLTDPKITQMVRLTEKDFEYMLKYLKEKIEIVNKQIK